MDQKIAAFIDMTWKQVGRKIRPLRRILVVRTLPPEQKVGLIWMPPKEAALWGGLAHQRTVRAVVMAAGPKATVKPGEVVAFTRLHFGWWNKFENDTYLGWVAEEQLSGYTDCEDYEIS